MMGFISILGSDILCERGDVGQSAVRIPLSDETISQLQGWTADYRQAVRVGDPPALFALGQALFRWLDQSGWATEWTKGTGPRGLEIAVNETDSPAATALLDLPWEILANGGDFLAGDPAQPLVVYRSIGRGRTSVPAQPAYRDLAALFMAASPRGQQELDYEAEEAAILQATEPLPMQLVVEESGCADFFKDRLAQDGPFEAVHLSCHGTLLSNGEPALALETPEGDLALARPGEFVALLGERKATLVFLSACRTAESSQEAKATVSEPFVRALIRAGVANALGWDGSVYDTDAIRFAHTFYRELADHATVPFAAAVARAAVLRAHRENPHQGRHWHLARVYVGPSGAGACCDRARPKRRLRKDAGFKEFLDEGNRRVPVATAQEFVGRRQEAQQILRAFRSREKAGVLLFGMGNLGKSSLAARIANRLPRHQTVVIYERYDALAIFHQLLQALPGSERAAWEQNWRETIRDNGARLGDALEELLEGPFDAHPILLIIDDLEQILAAPQPDQLLTPVKDAPGTRDAWRTGLAAVLRAFRAADTPSRLLLTSRYRFTLPDGRGRDLADTLLTVQLRPMRLRERLKQWRAAERVEEQDAGRKPRPAAQVAMANDLAGRALAVAGGNPGLQEILCRPILAEELEAAAAAIGAVEGWKGSGQLPQEANAAQEFFQRLAFATYGNALNAAQRTQLRAATLFAEALPVPLPALEAAGRTLGVADPEAALQRLTGLGLVDSYGVSDGVAHAAANPLARPLAGEPLTATEQHLLAAAALGPLHKAWRSADGDFPFDERGVEAARLALAGAAEAALLEAAAYPAGYHLFRSEHDAKRALALLQPALTLIEVQGAAPRPDFLRLAADCAARVGETGLQIALLEQGLALPSDDQRAMAQLAVTHAEATLGRDGPEKTLERLHGAIAVFEALNDVRSRAVTMGKIADILQGRGETDEALRIRREEELPVYERLGDVRSRAVTMGQIADILEGRGETDEALRIRREEQLPVYERLGDVRSRAVTMGKIADILEGRGETDEALRIRREEELPVYERLGDVRSRAVTMGQIADILQGRGETDEALRIRREEQLPVYERLGDVRSRAVTMGKIADILEGRGETDEALRIRREEELPVYERLGDVRSRAVTMGQIADILQGRGETDEALRIRREEELPVYERLGDVRSRAVTMGKIADILQGRGETDEALRIRREEELPVYERLGDVRSRAVTMGQIADILQGRGETDEALRILLEECLPIRARIQDVGGVAYVRYACARIRLERGGLQGDEGQIIIDELTESFTLISKLQRVDGIAVVGSLLGQVLAAVGLREDAIIVLDHAAAAFERMKQDAQAAQLREMQARLRAVDEGVTG